jgi:hypothetical protein
MMDKIIIKYPNICRIFKLPIDKRLTHIQRTPTLEKESFVKEVNDQYNTTSYEQFFRNKKVAIIGPSPSVRNTENGEFIESNYDIIVRINKQWKHDIELNKYIGERTDVLYNCISMCQESGGIIDTNYVIAHGIKYIISSIKYCYNDKQQRDTLFHDENRLNQYVFFHLNNKGLVPFGIVESSKYTKWDTHAGTRINTGLMAILDILHMDVKEVYVKGFTFFKDGYLNNYRSVIDGKSVNEQNSNVEVNKFMNKCGNHDQQKQWLMFKKILKDENIRKKIVMDSALEQIMNLDNFDN